MTFFLLNLFLTLGTSVWILTIYLKKRYLFVKPSMILLAYTHVFFQWPLVLLSNYCINKLQNPYILSFLIHGYMLLGLYISPLILQEKAKFIWNRMALNSNENHFKYSDVSVLILTLSIISVYLIYFSYVPFTKTGLYTLFSDPVRASIARENSLKLLDSQLIKYLYSLTRTSFVPLLFSFLFLRLISRWRLSSFNSMVTYLEITICIICIVFVSLVGEKSPLAYLIFLGVFIRAWKNNLKFNSIEFFLFSFLSFLIPIILIFLREEQTSIHIDVLLHYADNMLDRIFVMPFKVGVWYIKYVQDIGPFGIAAFEKLSKLVGIVPVNAPNIIGLKYSNIDACKNVTVSLPHDVLEQYASYGTLKSISAGAGYLFSYYAYLGLISFPISLGGLLALDLALFVYARLKDSFLIPCIASISLSILAFIQSDYTTCLITHGFIGVLLLSYLLSLGENYFSSILNNMRYIHVKK